MDNKIYIYLPILIALLMELIVPYFRTLHVEEVFLSPPRIFNIMMFLASYILFGYILYESREIGNDDIFIFTWIAIVLNLIWGYFINRSNRYTVLFLFLSLLFGYFIYNEIFLSSLTNNGRTLYLNLMSTYIVWVGFLVALVFQHEQIFGKKIKVKKVKK